MQYTIHKNLVIILGLVLCLYFAFHTFNGNRSYMRLSQLQQISSEQKLEISTLKNKKNLLEKRVIMMRPDSLSVDLVEEQARKYLGYHHKDEVVLLDSETL